MDEKEAYEYAVASGCEDPQAAAACLVETFPKKISEYTKEDFLESDQPYRLPMLYSREPLKQEQIILKIAEQARSVGITNYKTTVQKYMKSVPAPLVVNIADDKSYFTDFPDQPLALECGDKYICDKYGVQVLSETGLFGNQYKTVCSHPIMPVAQIDLPQGRISLIIVI